MHARTAQSRLDVVSDDFEKGALGPTTFVLLVVLGEEMMSLGKRSSR